LGLSIAFASGRRAAKWCGAQTGCISLDHDSESDQRELVKDTTSMSNRNDRALILVIEDVEEIRDGLRKLLNADGYRVDPARDEEEAAVKVARESPDLLLMSSGAKRTAAVTTMRQQLSLSDKVPVVIFCGDTIAEGTAQLIGANAFLSRPDNFNQLRRLLRCLLEPDASARESPSSGATE